VSTSNTISVATTVDANFSKNVTISVYFAVDANVSLLIIRREILTCVGCEIATTYSVLASTFVDANNILLASVRVDADVVSKEAHQCRHRRSPLIIYY